MFWAEGRMQSGSSGNCQRVGEVQGGSAGTLQAVWTSSPGQKPRDAKSEVSWTEALPAGLPGRSGEPGTGQTGDLLLKASWTLSTLASAPEPHQPFPIPTLPALETGGSQARPRR